MYLHLQNPCAFAGVSQPVNGALTITAANGALAIRYMPAATPHVPPYGPASWGAGTATLPC